MIGDLMGRSLLELELTARPQTGHEAREALRELDDELSHDVIDELCLLVTEVIVNAVGHATATREESLVLELEIDPEHVHAEVRDRAARAGEVDVRDELPIEGGWGLAMVDRLADRWGVSRGEETSVWFEIDLERTQDGAIPGRADQS